MKNQLAVDALYDCWKFFDLIKFKGGTQNFDSCHWDFVLVLQAPQLLQHGLLEGDYLRRWRSLTNSPTGLPSPKRMLKFPRGHFKSTLVVGWLMWRIYRNPNLAISHSTNIRELAESFIREFRSYFEDEKLQVEVWNNRPHIAGNLIPALDKTNRRYSSEDTESEDKKVVWNNYKLQMMRSVKRKEATIDSTSANSRSTGTHFDIIVMDDIVDFVNTETPGRIQKIKRWAGDVASVLTRFPKTHQLGVIPGGQPFYETTVGEYVVVGTSYHPNDYYAFLAMKAKELNINILERNIYKNGVDDSEGYLSRHFTKQMEDEIRAELSELPGVFEAQYMNFVKNPALQILDTSLVVQVRRERFIEGRSEGRVVFPHPIDGGTRVIRPIITVDPAISLRSQADFTAICVGGKTTKLDLVAIDFSVGHFSPDFTESEIVRLVLLWGVTLIYVEDVGFQALLRRNLIKIFKEKGIKCAVMPYTSKVVKNKLKRIEGYLSQKFSDGKVIMADEIVRNPRIMNTFDFFGRGGRDDPPDALAVMEEVSVAPITEVNSRTSRRARPMVSYNRKYGGIY